MTWQFTMEFSGITFLNLTKTGDDYRASRTFPRDGGATTGPFSMSRWTACSAAPSRSIEDARHPER